MRKVLCSIGIASHQELLEIARPCFEAYAAKHGYDLVLISKSTIPAPWPDRILGLFGIDERHLVDRIVRKIVRMGNNTVSRYADLPRPPSWEKIRLIRELFADYDAVFWIDSDAVIIDDSVDIAEEIEADKWLYITESYGHINAGVFLILQCAQSKRFLDDIWSRTAFIFHIFWEQAAMLDLLGFKVSKELNVVKVRPSPYETGIKIIDPSWNSIPPNGVTPARIRHYAGRSHLERVEQMTLSTSCLKSPSVHS
ncbi:hypothetical protein [Bradyrhizobium sp. McL0615]|uniref:hypothetical protein n=1 Tax=Bradyrhizobium sp. McL0615 TaxID=3415673 RepID=UPI003CF6E0BA